MVQLIDTFAPLRRGISGLAQELKDRPQRKLQQQILGQQQQAGQLSLEKLARGRQEDLDLQEAIQTESGKDPDLVRLEFLSKRNPTAAREFHGQLIEHADKLSDIDPQAGIDFLNLKTGTDLKLQNTEKGVVIGSAASGKQFLINPKTGETIEEFDFPKEEKPTTLQKDLIAAGLKPGTPEFQKAILASKQKPGQAFSVSAEGEVSFASGPGVGKQQKTTKKGFEFVDKEFAKDFVEWRVRGGSADAFKQIGQLEQALDNLESGQNLTGPIAGLTPDIALNIFNSEAINTEELVTEVVQRNLRIVLGAQFTEKEGERLIKRAYNRNLEEAVNAKRVKRLINQIKLSAKAKDDASDFFTENGTLEGYAGSLPTFDDFENINFEDIGVSEEITATNPETGEKIVLKDGKWVGQ